MSKPQPASIRAGMNRIPLNKRTVALSAIGASKQHGVRHPCARHPHFQRRVFAENVRLQLPDEQVAELCVVLRRQLLEDLRRLQREGAFG